MESRLRRTICAMRLGDEDIVVDEMELAWRFEGG